MKPPPPDHFPGFADEARDRRRVADASVPIDDRVRIALEWETCWTWAATFAASIADPAERSRATTVYAERMDWWTDAVQALVPEFEEAEGGL